MDHLWHIFAPRLVVDSKRLLREADTHAKVAINMEVPYVGHPNNIRKSIFTGLAISSKFQSEVAWVNAVVSLLVWSKS